MTTENSIAPLEQFALLQLLFKEQIQLKIADIELLWQNMCQNNSAVVDLIDLADQIHSLMRSASRFHAENIHHSMVQLEKLVTSFMIQDQQVVFKQIDRKSINKLFKKLQHDANVWQPSADNDKKKAALIDQNVQPVSSDESMRLGLLQLLKDNRTEELNKKIIEVQEQSNFYIEVMNQHNLISTADIAGNIIQANDKFCEISGYRREELIGQNHRVIKSNKHPDSFYKELWQTISSGKIWRGRLCNWKKNSEEYWVDAIIVPRLNAQGRVIEYLSARTDITSLARSEERHQRTNMFANIGSWDWDLLTNKMWGFDRITQIFGSNTSLEFIDYQTFLKIVHNEDRKLVIDTFDSCILSGADVDIEFRIIWSDHSIHWVQVGADVIRAEDGSPIRMLGVVQDINRRKQVEASFKESEEKYRLLFEFSEEPMLVLSEDNKFIMANQASVKMLGYGHIEELLELGPPDISPEYQADGDFSADAAREVIGKAYHDGYHCFEWLHQKQNGDIFPVLVSLTTIPYQGRSALFCVLRDLTEQRKAEQKITKQKQLLNLLHKFGTTFMIELDLKATMGGMLDALLEMTKSQYGFVGKVIFDQDDNPFVKTEAITNIAWNADTQALYEESAAKGMEFHNLKTLFGEVLVTGKVVISNEPKTDPRSGGLPKGHPVMDNFYGAPIFNGDQLVAMYGIANCETDYDSQLQEFLRPFDITMATMFNHHRMLEKAKQSHLQLIEAKDDAIKATQAKSQFLSSMSHELRTPMNVILGFSQLLQLDKQHLDQSQNENIDEIHKAGQHLLELINEVLELSTIEAGHMVLTIESVSLFQSVWESLQSIKIIADQRSITIFVMENAVEIDIQKRFQSGPFVLADPVRLQQVLLNLLSNAVKYNAEHGEIIVNFTARESNKIRVSISDMGKGIADDKQKLLFNAFDRLGAEYTNIEGTGIGLVITKKIIQQMQGDIGIESELGKGSTFWIDLPLDTAYKQKPLIKKNLVKGNQSGLANRDKTYSLLYIEDNPANLRMIDLLLGRLPHIHLRTAPEPLLGIQFAMEYIPDLILLDINLPGMSGFEVLKLLRQEYKTLHIPVIALSANAMVEDIEKGLQAGFDDYITKPIDVKLLMDVVEGRLIDVA